MEENTEEFSQVFLEILIQICHLCVPQKIFSDGAARTKKYKARISGLKRKQKRLHARIRMFEELNAGSIRISHLKSSLINVDCAIKSKLFLASMLKKKQLHQSRRILLTFIAMRKDFPK